MQANRHRIWDSPVGVVSRDRHFLIHIPQTVTSRSQQVSPFQLDRVIDLQIEIQEFLHRVSVPLVDGQGLQTFKNI